MRRILYLRVTHLQTTLERQWGPALAGQAVVVVGRPATHDPRPASGRRSLVVADASPEAEAEGVLAGMTERHARRRCPEGVFLAGERARYEPAAVMIGEVLAAETPWVERREIVPASRRSRAGLLAQEEFFADLGRGEAGEGLEIARRVAGRLAAELGLDARLVLATGRFAARALGYSPSEVRPHSCFLLPEGQERAFLRPLPIAALWEAPETARRRMALLGLRTLGQLAAVPRRWLIELFGPAGRWYGLLARGIDPRGVRAWNPAPAISAEADLPDTADRTLLSACLQQLAEGIAGRLLREGRYARRVTLLLTLENGRRLHATRALKEPTNLARALARTGSELLKRLVVQGPSLLLRTGPHPLAPSPNPGRGGSAQTAPFSPLSQPLGEGDRGGEGGFSRGDEGRSFGRMETEAAPASLALSVSELESHGALQLSIFGDGERGPALRAAVARLQERFGEEAIRTAAGLGS